MTEETKKTISRDEMFARLDMAKTLWPGAKADGTTAALASEAMSWIMDGRELEGSGGCGCKDKKPKSQERADLLNKKLSDICGKGGDRLPALTVRQLIFSQGSLHTIRHDVVRGFLLGFLDAHGLKIGMTEADLHQWIMNDK